MKTLTEMNNVERAYLLAKLFPDDLKVLTLFIGSEIERFRIKEEYFRSIWADQTIITVDFWYSLINNTERVITINKTRLYRNPKTFAQQLFDGYNAIFAINSLIEYTETAECNPKLKEAVYLFFGVHKMLEVTEKK
jgi:hypothetical protein